ncbi:hypothetical protein ACWENR_16235 [Micromonospora sp. NPDC004336]
MPPSPHRPSALAWQVFRGSDAVRRGLVTEHQLRSSAWIRLRHDVYADARLDRDHALACRGAVLRLPPEAVVAGPSAAYLHGVVHAATFADDVHVLLPRTIRVGPQRGMRAHTLGPAAAHPTAAAAALGPAHDGHRATAPATVPGRARDGRQPTAPAAIPGRAHDGHQPTAPATAPSPACDGRQPTAPAVTPGPARDGDRPTEPPTTPGRGCGGRPPAGRPAVGPPSALPLTAGPPRRSAPAEAAWETAVWLEPLRAVGIVDALLRQGLTSRDALVETADRHADRPGGRRARWVFDLADPAAASPAESQLRVRLVLAGLPRPVTRHPVRLPSGLVAHPHLAWPRHRVAVAHAGDPHVAGADQPQLDRWRLDQLAAAGWLVLHATSRRVHREFPALLVEVRAALAARGWR